MSFELAERRTRACIPLAWACVAVPVGGECRRLSARFVGLPMFGILAVDGGFELLCGEPAIGQRRHLDAAVVARLEEFSGRYYELLQSSQAAAGLLALGRELHGWLDGDDGQLNAFLQRADRPLRFEVCAANRYPGAEEWALLRAPWELLADQAGFLVGDAGLGFSPVRRLGRQTQFPPLDRHRLGLVFMAASPRGARELDYEAEETAIMVAVGATKLDLLVEESGNPDELGERLVEYAAMQALHLSCHGHNAWRPPGKPSAKPKPVLMLENSGRRGTADRCWRADRGVTGASATAGVSVGMPHGSGG